MHKIKTNEVESPVKKALDWFANGYQCAATEREKKSADHAAREFLEGVQQEIKKEGLTVEYFLAYYNKEKQRKD